MTDHRSTARLLAAKFKAGTISRTEEWRLLDEVERIAKAEGESGRYVWLSLGL